MKRVDFSEVTEQSGAPATRGQIGDTFQRYAWASQFCRSRRVIEVACGTGQGLGLVARSAVRVVGCDIEPRSIAVARATFGQRIAFHVAPAEHLPAGDSSFDVVMLFEALYYLPDVDAFLRECARVLVKEGLLLLTTVNKDLFDFVPSLFSQNYYGAAELGPLLRAHGFSCELFGAAPVHTLPRRHRMLRPLKAAARRLGLVPTTMRGKATLRTLLFGRLPLMPHDISELDLPYLPPIAVRAEEADRTHRFLYAVARRQE